MAGVPAAAQVYCDISTAMSAAMALHLRMRTTPTPQPPSIQNGRQLTWIHARTSAHAHAGSHTHRHTGTKRNRKRRRRKVLYPGNPVLYPGNPVLYCIYVINGSPALIKPLHPLKPLNQFPCTNEADGEDGHDYLESEVDSHVSSRGGLSAAVGGGEGVGRVDGTLHGVEAAQRLLQLVSVVARTPVFLLPPNTT